LLGVSRENALEVKGSTDSGKIGRAGRSLVKVENDDGRLRLRCTHGGKRYEIALELPDSKMNRTVAQQKAAQIELDIASALLHE
jgi:hypothetical protein